MLAETKAEELSLSGMESTAKELKQKLKELGYRERSTARMLARIHALFLAGHVSGVDIIAFISFLFFASGMPMKALSELLAGKTKKVSGLAED